MLFTRFAALAIPLAGTLAAAAPYVIYDESGPYPFDTNLGKRADLLSIVTDLQTKISDSVTQIQALNGSDIASENQLTAYLSDIGNNLDIANVAIGSVVVRKRDISDHPKENSVGARDISDHPKVSVIDARAEEIDEVAQVLAPIIADITNAVNDLSDDLKNLPAIGALIGSINGGLKTILLGVEVVLAGVVQLVDGLLNGLGLGGLLAGLGLGGLLGGILG